MYTADNTEDTTSPSDTMCEICGKSATSLYDASELADRFGLFAEYGDDDIYRICPDCLNDLEECIRRIWRRHLVRAAASGAEDGQPGGKQPFVSGPSQEREQEIDI